MINHGLGWGLNPPGSVFLIDQKKKKKKKKTNRNTGKKAMNRWSWQLELCWKKPRKTVSYQKLEEARRIFF